MPSRPLLSSVLVASALMATTVPALAQNYARTAPQPALNPQVTLPTLQQPDPAAWSTPPVPQPGYQQTQPGVSAPTGQPNVVQNADGTQTGVQNVDGNQTVQNQTVRNADGTWAQQSMLAEQAAAQSLASGQFLQAQILAQAALQSEAVSEQAAQDRAARSAAEDRATLSDENAAAAGQALAVSQATQSEQAAQLQTAAEAATKRILTLDSVTALDARGSEAGATLRWSLPAGGQAVKYEVYCDDGTLAAASTQHTVLASDECPSEIAFIAGTQPSSAWTPCAEVDGAQTTASFTGLADGQPYAFAIAARDEAGTVGPLSAASCAIPSRNGEYEFDAPTAATAQGEGCSVEAPGLSSAPLGSVALAGVVGLIALVSRRRR